VPGDLEKLFTDAWWQQPRVDLGVPADGAKVVIVKFIDWQCPSCKAAHYAYKPVLDRFAESHPGQVKQIIKDLPLSMKCNYTMPRDLHAAACEAAVAVRIAREKNKDEELINWIFMSPNQQGITPLEIREKTMALLGISAADFDREYAARIEAVKLDVADAAALKATSTPTYYVNGVLAKTQDGWLPPGLFELAIRLELGR
jgi:protein-disulfide isomerase